MEEVLPSLSSLTSSASSHGLKAEKEEPSYRQPSLAESFANTISNPDQANQDVLRDRLTSVGI